MGEKGKTSETVGQEAANKLLNELRSGACIDRQNADNLIPLMAMFGGKINTSEITKHTKTNIWVCEQFVKTGFIIKNNSIVAERRYQKNP